MARALLWLLGGLVLFAVFLLVVSAGELTVGALGPAALPIVPAVVVAVLVWDVRRRRGGHGQSDDPGGA